MWGACAGSLEERPAALAHSETCPIKDAPARCRREGLGVSDSSLQWVTVTVLLTEVQLCSWARRRGEDGITPLSSLERGICTCLCSGSLHRKVIISPLGVHSSQLWDEGQGQLRSLALSTVMGNQYLLLLLLLLQGPQSVFPCKHSSFDLFGNLGLHSSHFRIMI